jgi:hypothetical protein
MSLLRVRNNFNDIVTTLRSGKMCQARCRRQNGPWVKMPLPYPVFLYTDVIISLLACYAGPHAGHTTVKKIFN